MAETTRRKVLVVDDDQAVAVMYKRFFERAGLAASAACDVELALAEVQRDPPDLAVIDLVIAGGSGYDLCRAIRSRLPTEVFLITGQIPVTNAERLKGLEAGAVAFYEKLEPALLDSIVEDARMFLDPPKFLPRSNDPLPSGSTAVAAPPRTAEVLIVDDEEEWRLLPALHLKNEGFASYAAQSARRGLMLAHRLAPAAILLDFGLGDADGTDTLRLLRAHQRTKSIPVLIMTGHPSPGLERRCFKNGSEDFFVKGINDPAVLPARVRKLIGSGGARNALCAGPVEIDIDAREVRVYKEQIAGLTPSELSLLALVVRHSPHVVPWDIVEAAVRESFDAPVHAHHVSQTVSVHLTNLRHKLGPAAVCLITQRGAGLKFDPAKAPEQAR